jgi:hypothetical protein
VLLAGIKIKANIWDLITHDLSKFLPSELAHYDRQFYGKADDLLGFSYAWNHHQKCNKHHWEYWIPITGHSRGGYSDLQPLPMPERYIREMIADWMGACRAYEGHYPTKDNWPWWEKNKANIITHCHSQTNLLIFKIIEDIIA